jgi:hypothetical protein
MWLVTYSHAIRLDDLKVPCRDIWRQTSWKLSSFYSFRFGRSKIAYIDCYCSKSRCPSIVRHLLVKLSQRHKYRNINNLSPFLPFLFNMSFRFEISMVLRFLQHFAVHFLGSDTFKLQKRPLHSSRQNNFLIESAICFLQLRVRASRPSNQGCQMVFLFKPKIPILVNFGGP